MKISSMIFEKNILWVFELGRKLLLLWLLLFLCLFFSYFSRFHGYFLCQEFFWLFNVWQKYHFLLLCVQHLKVSSSISCIILVTLTSVVLVFLPRISISRIPSLCIFYSFYFHVRCWTVSFMPFNHLFAFLDFLGILYGIY